MKIFSINCQSWKTAKSNFGEIVDNYNIDVLCLTETFETVKEPVSFRQWSKISKPRKDGYGGVAILYKDSDTGVILEIKKRIWRMKMLKCCVQKLQLARITTFYWLYLIYHRKRKKN